MSGADDAQLVKRCRSGEQEAWNELVSRYSRYVYAIAVRGYGLAGHEAEDVFQDLFLKVYGRLDSLRDDSALRPWIAQLTRRLCLDRLSSGARETAVAEVEASASAALDELDEALDLHDALAALGEPCHELLDRFFARDESYRTISAALDLPAGTIASRISRCLRKLRERLEGRELAVSASGAKVEK